MPAEVKYDPLRVEFTFPNGTRCTTLFDATPNQSLAADLALGLTQYVHPLGTIASISTATLYGVALRRMVASLHEEGFTGGAGDLRRSHLMRFWLRNNALRETFTRRMLLGFDQVTGRLDDGLRSQANGRPLRTRTPTKPLEPYTEGEWTRLEEGLRQIIRQATSAQRQALELARQGEDPRQGGLSEENLAWLLVNEGPMSTAQLARWMGYLGAPPSHLYGKTGPARLRGARYPTRMVMAAYRLLFGVYSGIVPDGIAGLGMGDITWAGDQTVLLDYIKHRQGPESVTLPKRAVRVLERWLDLSALLRKRADAQTREQLWISLPRLWSKDDGKSCLTPIGAGWDGSEAARLRIGKGKRELAKVMGLLDDSGQPLILHTARIRTTYQNRLGRKGWTGMTTIDPNHSPRVEGDHYLTATTPAQQQAVEGIIAQAQADVLRRARPPVVLTSEEAAEFAAAHPEQIRSLDLDRGVLSELLSGTQDVFTAACADIFAGLHGPKGQPCPARPWVCLLCPLALYLPRHLPNLLRLKAYFARQSQLMTTDQFLAVFGPYADRLDREVLPRFATHDVEKAVALVTDDDSEIPLRPEEQTA